MNGSLTGELEVPRLCIHFSEQAKLFAGLNTILMSQVLTLTSVSAARLVSWANEELTFSESPHPLILIVEM